LGYTWIKIYNKILEKFNLKLKEDE